MKVVKKIKVLSSIKRFMKGEKIKKVCFSYNSLDNEIMTKTIILSNNKEIKKTYFGKKLNDVLLINDYVVGYYNHNENWCKVVA